MKQSFGNTTLSTQATVALFSYTQSAWSNDVSAIWSVI